MANRTIKFRVWCEYTCDGVKHTDMATAANWFLLTQTGHLFSRGPMQPLNTDIESEYDKLVVMFYTGFTDKNGVDLGWWDGDILTCQNGIFIEIFWHEKWGQWYGRYINSPTKIENPLVEYAINSYMKVVGNIHQNPELLEGN